ncbi:sensor histidine kinase [Peribacillus tepidiphilus]|uniref:sensor histidine kinase n=1 Tax=Peribacillus tepidiphilus TaxID=2652445 RepID=UPI001CDD23A7|nr:HAMP domain-containing sensor histidine kinase [Peribacillus tepidiphilus]
MKKEKGGIIEIQAYNQHNEVIIIIKDNGKGISKNQISKLSALFYSTKEKGTGVGLTISFQIVESMKGKVKVESQVGKGTTFTITFPSLSVCSSEDI